MTSPGELRGALLEQAKAWLEWEKANGGIGMPAVGARPQSAARYVCTPPAGRTDAPVPEIPQAERARRLDVVREQAAACIRCGLHASRTRSVFARGSISAEVVFVGEGPGFHEDQQGEPFVGRAGQLLDKMIAAMGYGRDDVYVCNVVKCRPPENRTPLPPEVDACSPFLVEQIATVGPKVIIALGRCAAEALGCVDGGSWRGRWGAFRGFPVMPTYHPAFLLRSPHMKRPVWEDLQKVMQRLGKGVAKA